MLWRMENRTRMAYILLTYFLINFTWGQKVEHSLKFLSNFSKHGRYLCDRDKLKTTAYTKNDLNETPNDIIHFSLTRLSFGIFRRISLLFLFEEIRI